MSVDPRFTDALLDDEAVAGARVLAGLAGRPDALVVLGSGLADALDEAWGAPAGAVSLGGIPGVVAPVADGHGGELRAYEACGGVILVATGRTPLYEGRGARPVTALARAAAAAGLIAEPGRRVSEEPGLLGGGGLHPGDQRRVRLLHHGQVEALGAAGGVHAVHRDDAPLLPAAPCLGELQVQAAP